MNIDAIHWHDCTLRRVVETPSEESITFEVDYPIDWESDIVEPRAILFSDVYGYEIHEGPFSGAPTILNASASGPDSYGVYSVSVETNAGSRLIRCKTVSLIAA